VTSVSHECGQWQDERTALSSTLISDVNESEHVDDKGEDDVLCDLLSRHVNDVGFEVFGDADEAVVVQQVDDTEAQNCCDQLTNSWTRLQTQGVEKCHDMCYRAFESSSSLECHKDIHTGFKTHKWSVLHEAYQRDVTKDNCTNSEERPYVCDICTKTFMTSSVLTAHRQRHRGGKSHECDVCHKQFTQTCNLKRHMLTHTGKRPHKCDVCEKQFTDCSNLKPHMRTHTSERPYKCDICQNTFTTRGNLKAHMLTHSGERPHKCDVCQKRFTKRQHLKTHMMTHTGERPHRCDVCQKQFIDSSTLKKHMLTHTGERPHKCDVCQKRFTELSKVRRHMVTHTAERP